MVTQLAPIERYLETGDVSGLSPAERIALLQRICMALELLPDTRPVQYITFKDSDGAERMQLYYTKDAAAQLTAKRRISVHVVERWREDGNQYMLAEATDASGRCVQDIGAVSLTGHRRDGGTWELTGDQLANAIMKCSTKAKRRAVLSFCGLGGLDESEIETIPRTRIQEDSAALLPSPETESTNAIEQDPNVTELIRRAKDAGCTTPKQILKRLGIELTWGDAIDGYGGGGLLRAWERAYPQPATEPAIPLSQTP